MYERFQRYILWWNELAEPGRQAIIRRKSRQCKVSLLMEREDITMCSSNTAFLSVYSISTHAWYSSNSNGHIPNSYPKTWNPYRIIPLSPNHIPQEYDQRRLSSDYSSVICCEDVIGDVEGFEVSLCHFAR